MTNLSDTVVTSRKFPNLLRYRRLVPFIWLPYSLFFLLTPFFEHASAIRWLQTGVGAAFFFVFYFGLFWSAKPWNWFCLAGLVSLGLIFIPINPSAACFIIYSCAFAPFMAETESKAIKIILTIIALSALEIQLLHLSWALFIYSGGFAGVIAAGNIFFAQRNRANEKLRMAHEEIEHLAKVAERERIARDMHDVLGHTLSVIILKSELAGKLIDLDPERAKNEIRDVEQTSRQALADVRNTIRGYRAQSLSAEFKQAKATLETAGVTVIAEAGEVNLTPAQESVAALIVREAVTNVVRHAAAHSCSLRLSPLKDKCLIEIQDDGRGSDGIEGNGLRGMRERIEALGGTLNRETTKGTKLTIQFPLAKAAGTQ